MYFGVLIDTLAHILAINKKIVNFRMVRGILKDLYFVEKIIFM